MMIFQLIGILLLVFIPHTAFAQFDFLEDLKEKGMEQLGVSGSAGLSNEKIISGLKEALEVGAPRKVAKHGQSLTHGWLWATNRRVCREHEPIG
jgi:hypothetical protein